jgi:hypothetical protein
MCFLRGKVCCERQAGVWGARGASDHPAPITLSEKLAVLVYRSENMVAGREKMGKAVALVDPQMGQHGPLVAQGLGGLARALAG